VADALVQLKDSKYSFEVVLQTGQNEAVKIKEQVEKILLGSTLKVTVEPFLYDMPEQLQKAHIVIARAGSSTLSEIARVGRPSILIPFPQASDNHQEKNADFLVTQNAAVKLSQGSTTGLELANLILRLCEDPTLRAQIATNVRHMDAPSATASILARIT
jgi:UDP-N-acetylglucosamine--N-acetylmuramyl-(pentapeptide) pyrophosphoryl-undecaprenol N-acetylglucosamine transferase